MTDINGKSKNGTPVPSKVNGGSPKPRFSMSPVRRPIRSPSPMDSTKKRNIPSNPSTDTDFIPETHFGLSGNPLSLQLKNLESELKVKEGQIESLIADNKSAKQMSVGKEKAIAALQSELERVKEKQLATEKMLADKMLELKNATDQKKVAFASQAAAESTVRRLQAGLNQSSGPSVDNLTAPLEARLKMALKDVAKLTEDKKAQERLMRNKESALLQAEKDVEAAQEKAKQVDDLLNSNKKLSKEIESLQDENKTLDKMYKQKVEEVHHLSQQVAMLEESLTAAGGVASTIKDYQRQLADLQAELKSNQEELARAKVAVNRVAVVVANEWKDENERVVPLQQWLEERRLYQCEVQMLKDRLAQAEKSVKFEAQMKEKFQTRLKVIEESLKSSNHSVPALRDANRRYSTGGALSSDPTGGKTAFPSTEVNRSQESLRSSSDGSPKFAASFGDDDVVSGALHGVLEKEVATLRKAGLEKDQALKDKEDAIEMLSRKVELLSKALETESRKARRELTTMEKELNALKLDSSPDPKRRLSLPRLSSPSTLARKTSTGRSTDKEFKV